ncbi:MAG: GatB/YqeY domain-containing protein [Bdellovibrionaceae bacterium]|nr:GatB/YqeY domain-containing protein [Pseudobdellovibrionaceae bacterium]
MGLKEQISNDMKEAMKAKEMDKLNALRMVQAAFKNREIELRPNPINEDELIGVLKKLVKQRKESIEQYAAAKRQDLVDNETRELHLLETYLPAQMGREQIEKIVADVIAETGAKSQKEMGAVMKTVIARTAGAADNKIVSEIVKSKLQ